MRTKVHAIELPLPFRLGTVNAYLLETNTGFVLVDTGTPRNRGAIEWALAESDCGPDELGLIVLTHGDFDHIGTAAYLRREYRAKIAMHEDEAVVPRTGDMFASRSKSNALASFAVSRLIGFGKKRRFKPNILLEDGESLQRWGLDATVLALPGHSAGSIGVLTSDGDLICGDLLDNTKVPAVNSIMDDREQALASLARIRTLDVRRVYPGHGKPFTLDEIAEEESA